MSTLSRKAQTESKKSLLAWQVAEIKDGIKEADAGELVSPEKVDAFFRSWNVKVRRPSRSEFHPL